MKKFLRPATFKYVESEIQAYIETKAEYSRLQDDILHSAPISDDSAIRASGISDRTASIAIELVNNARLQRLKNVIDAIDYVYSSLQDHKKELIQIRYWNRPQTLTWDGIALELNASRISVLRWRNEIVIAISDRLGLK